MTGTGAVILLVISKVLRGLETASPDCDCVELFQPSNARRKLPAATALERFLSTTRVSESDLWRHLHCVEIALRHLTPPPRHLLFDWAEWTRRTLWFARRETVTDIRAGRREATPDQKRCIALAVSHLLGRRVTVATLFGDRA